MTMASLLDALHGTLVSYCINLQPAELCHGLPFHFNQEGINSMTLGKRGSTGSAQLGTRFGRTVWKGWVWIFKVNEFSMQRRPFTIPRTDEEIAHFMRFEYRDHLITASTVKTYRNKFNKGLLTQSNCPDFMSTEWKEGME